jgi:hypothetical protein
MQELGFHLLINMNITAIILMRVIPVVLIQNVIKTISLCKTCCYSNLKGYTFRLYDTTIIRNL